MDHKDPVSLEIIQSSLQAISDEMFAAMRKTAMSAIIYEVLDMGTGITDAEGEIASSGAGIPAFIGVLDKAVRKIIELHDGPGDIEPGDVFVTNDPYYGGVTHLSDIVLAMPVFAHGELIAWTANIAHWNDIGGMVPGSMSTEAQEIFQEGLRVPCVKLITRGTPIRSVMDIFRVNSRLPDFLTGDLWAGIAAVRIGERRILELVHKYGVAVFREAMQDYMNYGEQVSLEALKTLPQGHFSLSEVQDNGLIYNVVIEIQDEHFIVDLCNNPDQDKGPNNASYDGVLVAVQMLFKSVTDPYSVCNSGTFRPLTLRTRKGSVFDAREPAALGFYFEVEVRVYDLIWRCLAPHMTERLGSGHFASICGTIIGGPHPDTGRFYTIVEPEVGGWGGYEGGDGNSAVFSGFHGETFNCPAEISEARNGLYVDSIALNDAPGGEGKWRGGKGVCIDYRVRSDGCFLTCAYTRSSTRPWGLDGGQEGSSNYVDIIRSDGATERYSFVTGLTVNTNDVIRVTTGCGGGFGDPGERDRLAIENDIRDGYVTHDRARELYGFDASVEKQGDGSQ